MNKFAELIEEYAKSKAKPDQPRRQQLLLQYLPEGYNVIFGENPPTRSPATSCRLNVEDEDEPKEDAEPTVDLLGAAPVPPVLEQQKKKLNYTAPKEDRRVSLHREVKGKAKVITCIPSAICVDTTCR